MDTRVTVALVLALTMVVAGCFGSGTPTPTAEPGPFGGEDPPPGTDETGVTDVDGLLSAHKAELKGQSATVDMTFTLTVNGTGRNVSVRGKVLPGEDRGWMRVGFPDGVGTYYTADGVTYYKEIVNGSTSYGTTDQVSAVPEKARFGADERIRTAVTSAEWEPVGTVQRDGTTLVEFRATSVDPPNVNTTGDVTVDSSGRLLVSPEGVVHHVSVSTTVENERGIVEYGLEVSISDVGETTVEEPTWLDKAD